MSTVRTLPIRRFGATCLSNNDCDKLVTTKRPPAHSRLGHSCFFQLTFSSVSNNRFTDTFVSSYLGILGRPPVRPLDIQSVRNWLLMNHLSAISTAESSFVNHTDSLIAVQSKRNLPYAFSWKGSAMTHQLLQERPFGPSDR
jgi:hypothetical protein